MKIWTFAQVNQKVREDLDLQDEEFITPDEMVGYANEAIHEAESLIMKLNEDYLLQTGFLALTQGTSIYPLPTDIYGQKIRQIVYNFGSVQYQIRRIRGANKFEIMAMINTFGLTDDYMYILTNTTPGTQSQILISPPSRETSTQNVQTYYIRSAGRIPQAAELSPPQDPTAPNTSVQLNTPMDIPEFATFLIDFIKYKCLLKDTDPRLPEQKEIMLNQRQMMVDSLTEQVPDDDNKIVPDMTWYTLSS